MTTYNKYLKAVIALLLGFLGTDLHLYANNIVVSNTSITGRNVSAGLNNTANFSLIRFDLSWENSYRMINPNSWDAAWVFAKFRLGTADYLSAAGASSSGTTITVASTNGLRVGMPVFVNSGVGAFASGTVIVQINNGTTFTVSTAPTTALGGGSTVVRAERIWEHCWLNNTGHNKGSIGSNGSLQVGLQNESAAFHAVNNPVLGAYIYRSVTGSGSFSTNGAALRWNYGAQGIKDNDIVDIKVFAVEMVQVPQGAFQIQPDISSTSLLINGDGTNSAQNNTFLDASSNNFTITRVGNVAQGNFSPFCTTGGSAYFDGSGDYLSVPDNSAFDFGAGNFTIESWINMTAFPSNSSGIFSAMLACQDGSGTNRSWTVQLSGTSTSYTSIGITLFSGGSPFGTSANFNFALNTWYHVALVRNGTSIRIYVNGEDIGGGTNSTNASNSASNITIGAEDPVWHGSYPYWFPGYISNLRILKGTAQYTTTPFTPSTAPLTAITNTSLLLNFQNDPVFDASLQHNVETAGHAQISTAQSRFGGSSLAFDGNGDFLTLADADALDMGVPFTWECWVWANNAQSGAWRAIYSKRNSTGWFNGPILYISPGNALTLYETFNNSSWGINALTAGTTLPLNTWVHVAVSWDGSNYRIFQNGSQVAILNSTSPPAINASNLYIGAEVGGANPLNGFIDDIRITKGAALYNTTTYTVPTASLVFSPVNTFTISSENQINLGSSTAGSLQYNVPNVSSASDFNSTTAQSLPAAYPKGFNGFYCMKYEITQNQWREFFNTLSTLQRDARDITALSTAPLPGKNSDGIVFRNNLSWSTGDATLNGGTHGAVACNYLSWMDGLAYADWAGLRPMTELEFEKAGRGTFNAQGGETAPGGFCGGAPRMTPAVGISNSGTGNEATTNSTANVVFGNFAGVQGPLRVGTFAKSNSSRSSAGASFCGIMELSGNLWEQVVSMGNIAGRTFTGTHGDGSLTSAGHANVSTWPGFVTNANTAATGSGRRGGSWEDALVRLRISDRFESNTAVSTRTRANGFRTVRNLPSTTAQ